MLASYQCFEVSELGARRRLWALHAAGLWIHVVRQSGLAGDEALVPTLGFGREAGTRNMVTVQLGGRGVVRHGGRIYENGAGTMGLYPGRSAYRARLEASTEESFSIVVEVDRRFDSASPFAPARGRIGGVARLRTLTDALCAALEGSTRDERRDRLDAAVVGLLAGLRTEGVALPAIDPRALPEASPMLRAVARGIDRALSRSGTRPMVIDLEDAASARTAHRAMPALCGLWGQSSESLGAHMRRIQLGRGTGLMTDPRATTEAVARVLGFSTPNAFCRAMRRYGLPSPGAVRDRFREVA